MGLAVLGGWVVAPMRGGFGVEKTEEGVEAVGGGCGIEGRHVFDFEKRL